MKRIILITLLVFPLLANAQDCNCEKNFNWVKETFEKNDAGFTYVINSKGNETYQKHNAIFLNKVKNISDLNECVKTIYEWSTFFRKGHIGFQNVQSKAPKKLSKQEIIKKYKDTEKVNIDLENFKDYLKSKKTQDYEGFWDANQFKVGVKKIGNEYIGFITEADGTYWTKNQVKFKIKSDGSVDFYMKDHSKHTFNSADFIGTNFLEMGFVNLVRVGTEIEPEVKKYLNKIFTRKPFFEKLNKKTAYIRIPSFRNSNKKNIDSLILAHKSEILKTENLIIDLRNNGGGSDRSYEELLPIIYTNPIRTVGTEFLSTETNNRRMLEFSKDTVNGFDQKFKDFAKKSYIKLSKHIGEYVNLEDKLIRTTTFGEIYEYPKNIGIIINDRNASATEQFLLASKQSKKVKLFGTTTAGVLDISNMYYVKSPCEEFEFGYGLSRSARIPGMTIDGKGIQPDFYIDKTIPKHKWIEFVTKKLSE